MQEPAAAGGAIVIICFLGTISMECSPYKMKWTPTFEANQKKPYYYLCVYDCMNSTDCAPSTETATGLQRRGGARLSLLHASVPDGDEQ
jgi:hypothetical protein